MAEITLQAQVGRTTGTRSSGRLRTEGRIPGIIYGHGISPLAVSVDGRELRSALTTESGLNALLALHVDGATHLTMARELQRHPVKGTVVHVDFQVVSRDEIMSADVPVNLIGEAEAVHRADGVVEQQLYSITVLSTPDRIPHSIDVDISALEMGDAIRVADLRLPDGVTTELDPDDTIVMAAAAAEEIAPETEGEAAEGEAADAAAAGGDAEG